ncbi:MAG: D-alanyl-D-alanine carboxypeptidase [Clostridia bacterium]|nr:D-alanyl-D-alanine carboxypeptidase [Clostridia bacterium]
MFKKTALCFLIITSLILNLFAIPAFAAPIEEAFSTVTVAKLAEKTDLSDLKAKSAVLMDANTGTVLFDKNSHEKLPFASVTKVMTMLLVMEAIDSGKVNYDDQVPVSIHAYEMGGSQIDLDPREVFSVHDLLKALAIQSANDAAVALAEKVAGSEEAFVQKMNEKAAQLGMKNTKFLDSNGLTDEGHYSSAYDIALMSRELISKHPDIIKYSSTWHETIRDGKTTLDNTNKLIKFYDGCDGLKTGFTTKAGFCLSATAKRNDMRLISVVLGAPNSNTRFAETRKLLDTGFKNYIVSILNKKGEEVTDVEIKKGLKTSVKGIYKEDARFLLEKGDHGKIEHEVKIQENITAPLKAGQKIGEVLYKVGDKEIGKAEIVAESDVDKASVIRLFFRMVVSWFSLGRK